MPHAYTLVFRFLPESPLTSADIEDDIAKAIENERGDHVVDGNEIGDGIDIFVFTNDPSAVLEMCRPMFERQGLLDAMIAAYRRTDGRDFVVIYPAGYEGTFQL